MSINSLFKIHPYNNGEPETRIKGRECPLK